MRHEPSIVSRNLNKTQRSHRPIYFTRTKYEHERTAYHKTCGTEYQQPYRRFVNLSLNHPSVVLTADVLQFFTCIKYRIFFSFSHFHAFSHSRYDFSNFSSSKNALFNPKGRSLLFSLHNHTTTTHTTQPRHSRDMQWPNTHRVLAPHGPICLRVLLKHRGFLGVLPLRSCTLGADSNSWRHSTAAAAAAAAAV